MDNNTKNQFFLSFSVVALVIAWYSPSVSLDEFIFLGFLILLIFMFALKEKKDDI